MYENYKVKRMRVMGIIPPPTCMRRWARAASDRYFRSVCAYGCDPGKNGGVAFEDLPEKITDYLDYEARPDDKNALETIWKNGSEWIKCKTEDEFVHLFSGSGIF